MVENPETDPFISWSVAGNSFIVWNSVKLSNNILPNHFKHNNFYHFLRQVNTYGFKKISKRHEPLCNMVLQGFKKISKRCEYANPWFQRGKKHLLKNIKRKTSPSVETTEIQKEQDTFKLEILKVRQLQETSQNLLATAEEGIRCVECQQNQVSIFLAKALYNTTSIQKLNQQKRKQDGGEIGKKRKMVATQSAESLPNAMDTILGVNCENQVQQEWVTIQSKFPKTSSEEMETSHQRVDCRNQVKEEVATIQSEMRTLPYAVME
ncbi:hypothetical protein L1049_023192 [Liquidambar formosana]|uniref:HSF-type DNA-binding domain-containing protein n=1 Tax=Liquidambar formosana TaxID=63359 RepID=A0AAP0WS55_LIQFO